MTRNDRPDSARDSPPDRAELLKGWALEAGFDRAGVARLDPSEHGAHLRRWIENGDHAQMEWIARRVEVRENPSQLLEGARTALCVALQYTPLAEEPKTEGDLWPKVARYARGLDYHDVMGRWLQDLEGRIRSAFPGCVTRRYVDTGPILERELAARAGLGIAGKNTNLLHRQYGSYFLLGEILLTLDLEPDEPLTDLCGRCTRCLDACPTEALREPYRLDSRRCISYWTIEHRGSIPRELRDQFDGWVFGCDICQEVCPYNINGRPPTVDHPELRLPEKRRELDLSRLLGLDREQYVERFRKSPMKRAKLPGLKRNAAIAMGTRGRPEYIAALTQSLMNEDDAMVREHAAWALGRIGTDEARRALQVAQEWEGDPGVRREIEASLRELGLADPAGSPEASSTRLE